MALEMIKRYITSIIYSVILLGLLGVPLSVAAQQELTREERIKILEQLKMEDKKIEVNTLGLISPKTSIDIEKLELPPLSVFLGAVTENALVKKAQSQVEQVKNQYRLEKRNWWNYFRLNGNYSYGRYNIIGNASDEFTPMYQTTMSSAQHNFNVGASVGITLGDLFNRPLKLKDYRYQIEQLQYMQEDVMEERRLKVLEAYNAVTEQLATIKAKAETAALYNAQMKISENNFIQGTVDIISLSLERARRTGAVTTYEQSRVALHNSIVLLEMLTNVKVISDKETDYEYSTIFGKLLLPHPLLVIVGKPPCYGIGHILYTVSAIQLYGKQQSICRCNQQHQSGRKPAYQYQQYLRQYHQYRQVQEHFGKGFGTSACNQPRIR